MGLHKREGIALITTLMIIALLMAVVVEFNRIANADIDVSQNSGDEKRILYVTISGLNAIRELLRLDKVYSRNDTLFEEWARSDSRFKSATSMLEEGQVEGEISDETGKINVNSLVAGEGKFNEAQRGIWARLLSQPRFALSEDQVNTVIHGVKDWIDADDEITGIHGAEESVYLQKGYHCRNGYLHTLEEMLLVNGVTEEIFYGTPHWEGIRPYFTVFGDGEININTAPIPVLMALSDDVTDDVAKELDEFRKNEANKTDLANKLWYRKARPFTNPLPDDLLSVSSNFFSVHIKGTLRNSVKEVHAVISRSDFGTRLVYWREEQA